MCDFKIIKIMCNINSEKYSFIQAIFQCVEFTQFLFKRENKQRTRINDPKAKLNGKLVFERVRFA